MQILRADAAVQRSATVSHLENQVACSLAIKSPKDFHFWLNSYVRYLVQEGKKLMFSFYIIFVCHKKCVSLLWNSCEVAMNQMIIVLLITLMYHLRLWYCSFLVRKNCSVSAYFSLNNCFHSCYVTLTLKIWIVFITHTWKQLSNTCMCYIFLYILHFMLGMENKLREVCDDLLGPLHGGSRDTASSSSSSSSLPRWDPTILV